MNAPQKIPAVRAGLRAATDAIHQALHRAAPFAAIADGTATLESYGATLIFLHRYHSAMQLLCLRGAMVLQAPELADAHAARIAALAEDLAHFGCAQDVALPPQPVPDEGFCIGALYTVQGSTLGGKVIHRQLDRLLPDDAGRRFFKGTPDDGRHWQTLCAALERHAGALDRLEQGAQHGFEMFEGMLTRGSGETDAAALRR